MTPLDLFVAAVSEAGFPPVQVVEYAPDHRAAFWPVDGMPGDVARKACDLLGLKPNRCPTADGFHLGYRIDVDDLATIAYELGPIEAAYELPDGEEVWRP